MDKKYVEGKASQKKKRYDLTTVEGGWVELRRMNHGVSLERTDNVLVMSMHEDGSRSVRASNVLGRRFDFANCIIDHNIAFGGEPCDFSDEETVDNLDEDIGDEVQHFINLHHGRAVPGGEGPESDPN